jgi:glycosyltransferase involved in cell wall biosynthesis
MACGVPVIGSDSGEIPQVIGDAGLIFPEERADLLQGHLARLLTDPDLRAEFSQRGRARVLARYTQEQIAIRTYRIYQAMLRSRPRE